VVRKSVGYVQSNRKPYRDATGILDMLQKKKPKESKKKEQKTVTNYTAPVP